MSSVVDQTFLADLEVLQRIFSASFQPTCRSVWCIISLYCHFPGYSPLDTFSPVPKGLRINPVS